MHFTHTSLRRGLALLSALLLTVFCCACAPNDSQTPTVPSASDGDALLPSDPAPAAPDDEVAAAIASGESTLFWRIDEAAQLTGSAKEWSYTYMDSQLLWDMLADTLFPTATVLSDETTNENYRHLTLQNGDNKITASISDWGINICGLSEEAALSCAEDAAALLSQVGGCEMRQRTPDTFEGEAAVYAYYLEDTPLDTEANNTTDGSYLKVYDNGDINIIHPVCIGTSQDTIDLAACFSMEEAELLCELQWERASIMPLVGVLDDYELIYMLDASNGMLRPAWRFTGMLYDFTGTFSHLTDFLILAQTGEIIRY